MKDRFYVELQPYLRRENITQGELAKRLGISATTLSEFATGNRSGINKKILALVMDYFHLTQIDEIIKFVPLESEE